MQTVSKEQTDLVIEKESVRVVTPARILTTNLQTDWKESEPSCGENYREKFKKSFREIKRSDAGPFHLNSTLDRHCHVLITIFKNHCSNLVLHLPYHTLFVSWEVLEIPQTAWHTGRYEGKVGSKKLKSDSVVTFYGFRENDEAYLTLHQITHLV